MSLFNVIETALKTYPEVTLRFDAEGNEENKVILDNGRVYTVDLDDFEAHGIEVAFDTDVMDATYERPLVIFDHVSLLDAILHAIATSPLRESVQGLTTDGDDQDCEVIFNLHDYPKIIKVR